MSLQHGAFVGIRSFMVGIQHGSNRIQGRGASVARDGGLPSDLLNVLTEASDYLKRKKSGGVMA